MDALLIIGCAVVLLSCIGYCIHISRKNEERDQGVAVYIVKTIIVDSSHTATASSKTKTGSAVGRATMGAMIAGPIGALVGAGTAKKKTKITERHTTTFMIYYSDGTRCHATVENGSSLYNRYMEKLELN